MISASAPTVSRRNRVPRGDLQAFLGALEGYVVLRNHDIFANLERGTDIDLFVADAAAAERTARRHLGPPLWTSTRPHLRQLLYAWGNIDLFPTTIQWKGAPYLHIEEALLSAQRSHLGFPKPRPAHEAVVSWLGSILWGGFFKERYREIIIQAARTDGHALYEVLAAAFGAPWARRLYRCARAGAPEQAAQWTRSLQRRLWWRSFRKRPAATASGWLARITAEITLRIRPPVPWLAVLGPDGSGKSSVLDALAERLSSYEITRGHWRPGLLLPWDSSADAINPDPHGTPARGMPASAVKIFFLLADWLLGYWTRIANLRSKCHFVLFDRHYVDLLIDPRRYRFRHPMWLARLGARLVPKPDLFIVLDAPPDVLQQRKQEVPAAETARQRDAYRALADRLPNVAVVNANRPLAAVVDDVEALLLSCTTDGKGQDARRHQTPDIY